MGSKLFAHKHILAIVKKGFSLTEGKKCFACHYHGFGKFMHINSVTIMALIKQGETFVFFRKKIVIIDNMC